MNVIYCVCFFFSSLVRNTCTEFIISINGCFKVVKVQFKHFTAGEVKRDVNFEWHFQCKRITIPNQKTYLITNLTSSPVHVEKFL